MQATVKVKINRHTGEEISRDVTLHPDNVDDVADNLFRILRPFLTSKEARKEMRDYDATHPQASA